MNTAQPNNSETLLTLQEAATRLNVSVETLLSWNEHNILKPTITKEGRVGYTENQLYQFSATIQKVIQHANPAVWQTDSLTPATHPTFKTQSEQPALTPEVSTWSEETTSLQAITHNANSDNTVSQFSSKRMLVFAILLIILTSVFTQDATSSDSDPLQQQQPKHNVLGSRTSTLTLSEQLFAALPIHLARQSAEEKQLQNDQQTNAFKKETIASTLYSSKQTDNKSSTTTNIPTYNANRTTAINPNSYTATAFFQSATDETSAIDEHGNIKGEAEAETLAMVVGNINEQIKTDSLKQASTHATNQLLLIFLGMFAVLFGLHKQLAFVHDPGKKGISIQPVTYDKTPLASEKILEVMQKTDGSVMLLVRGTEYRISKPEMNSESDQFIEKLMSLTQTGLKEIEYDTATADAIRFATPLSRLVTRLGFVGIKRDIFFPRTAKTSVVFRRYVTSDDLTAMNLTVDQLLNELELLS